MPETIIIGVDVGGTNVRARAYSGGLEPISPVVSHPSNAQSGVDATVSAICSAISEASSGLSVNSVGMAVPGHIDSLSGTVIWAPNFGIEVNGVFRYWQNVPLGAMVREKTGLAVTMENDANLAALGEYRFGSGRNSAKCLVMLTLGTGVGGGVVMAPSAVRGKAGSPLLLLGGNRGGAELGHTLVLKGGMDCTSGDHGSIEAYCQRDAVVRRAVHLLRRGRKSVLHELSPDLANLTPKHLSQAADQGDAVALQVWREIGEFLGCGIGSLINAFAPDVFAIGGQIALAGEYLLEPARNAARDYAIPSLYADTTIVQATVLEDAGLLGAAMIASEAV